MDIDTTYPPWVLARPRSAENHASATRPGIAPEYNFNPLSSPEQLERAAPHVTVRGYLSQDSALIVPGAITDIGGRFIDSKRQNFKNGIRTRFEAGLQIVEEVIYPVVGSVVVLALYLP